MHSRLGVVHLHLVSLKTSPDAVAVVVTGAMMVSHGTRLVGDTMLAFMAVAGFAEGATPAGGPASVIEGHFFFLGDSCVDGFVEF